MKILGFKVRKYKYSKTTYEHVEWIGESNDITENITIADLPFKLPNNFTKKEQLILKEKTGNRICLTNECQLFWTNFKYPVSGRWNEVEIYPEDDKILLSIKNYHLENPNNDQSIIMDTYTIELDIGKTNYDNFVKKYV